jgi:hypothetical protein
MDVDSHLVPVRLGKVALLQIEFRTGLRNDHRAHLGHVSFSLPSRDIVLIAGWLLPLGRSIARLATHSNANSTS